MNNRIGRYKLAGADPGLRPVRPALGEAAMIAGLRSWADRLLGRGDATITVPSFDGALKPNQILEQAETVAAVDAPEDLASDGNGAFRRRRRGDPAPRRHGHDRGCAASTGPITALCCLPDGGMAVALDGARGADLCDAVGGGVPPRPFPIPR